MANRTAKAAETGKQGQKEPDSPPIDSTNQSVRKTLAKERGYVNYQGLHRTDDPVRMYLREMGSIELLSRQGEIEIAKRIEAGREKMIAGICESPLTLDAIVQWRDELKNGTTLLREVVDLNATYDRGPGVSGRGVGAGAAPGGGNGQNAVGQGQVGNSDDDDDDDADNTISLAMEALLTPDVLDQFSEIASTYKKVRRLQTSCSAARLRKLLKTQSRR